jgi:hypothetical protein
MAPQNGPSRTLGNPGPAQEAKPVTVVDMRGLRTPHRRSAVPRWAGRSRPAGSLMSTGTLWRSEVRRVSLAPGTVVVEGFVDAS